MKLNKIAILIGSMLSGLLVTGGLVYAIALLPYQQGGTGLGYPVQPTPGAILFENTNTKLATSSNLKFATSTNTLTTNSLILSGLSGSGTKCLHADNTGLLGLAAADCGSGGGGSSTISTSTPLVSGQVDFSTGVNTIGNDSQFYWDSTNHELGVGGTPGTAKLYVNGNVGIGVNSPGAPLDVGYAANGGVGIRLTGTGAGVPIFQLVGNSQNFSFRIQGNDRNQFEFRNDTLGYQQFGLFTSGNNAIGSWISDADDLSTLEVRNASSTAGNTLLTVVANANQTGDLQEWMNSSMVVLSKIDANGNASTTALSTSGSAYFATSGGSAGVGTTTPFGKLSVNAPGGLPPFVVGSSTATQLIVDQNGNVGIGTSNPTFPLYVYTPSGNTRAVIDTGGSGSESVLSFANQGSRKFELISQPSAGSQYLSIHPVSTGLGTALVIANNANIGIGTTTPTSALDVNGNTRLENQGQIRFEGLRANGGAYASLSATSTMTSNVNWTLPQTDGTIGQVLSTNGVGNLNWITKGSGTVTSIGLSSSGSITYGSTPVTTSGTITGDLNMANANTWTALQTFANATSTLLSSSYASSTTAYNGTLYLPNIGTAAGTFLAADANGKVIATSTPTSHSSNYQVFTSNGTWTKPVGLTGNEMVKVQLWGAGGGGAGCDNSNCDGGGGGGGAYVEMTFRASDLTSTVSVTTGTVGTGGAAGVHNGTAGGNTTFGSYATAYGGGAGASVTNQGGGGGGGGGTLSVGSNGSGTSIGNGGGPLGGISGRSESSFGGGYNTGNSAWGGGGGAQENTGGSSMYGGGGGGSFNNSGLTSGGTSLYGGNGGSSNTNSNGVNGTAPGGGGGGGSSRGGGTFSGGDGARGEVRVWVTYN